MRGWASRSASPCSRSSGSFGAADNQAERKDIDGLSLVFVLLGPLALAVSDRYPRLAVAATIGATTVYVGLGYPYGPIFVSVAVAMFLAVQAGELRPTDRRSPLPATSPSWVRTPWTRVPTTARPGCTGRWSRAG